MKMVDIMIYDGFLTEKNFMMCRYVFIKSPFRSLRNGVIMMDTLFQVHLRRRDTRVSLLAVHHLSLSRLRRIIIPVHEDVHWWAVCIDFAAKKVSISDSLVGDCDCPTKAYSEPRTGWVLGPADKKKKKARPRLWPTGQIEPRRRHCRCFDDIKYLLQLWIRHMLPRDPQLRRSGQQTAFDDNLLQELETVWEYAVLDTPQQHDERACGVYTAVASMYFAQDLVPFEDVPYADINKDDFIETLRQWLASIVISNGNILHNLDADSEPSTRSGVCLLKI